PRHRRAGHGSAGHGSGGRGVTGWRVAAVGGGRVGGGRVGGVGRLGRGGRGGFGGGRGGGLAGAAAGRGHGELPPSENGGNANPGNAWCVSCFRFAGPVVCGPTSMDALHRGFVNTGFQDSLRDAISLVAATSATAGVVCIPGVVVAAVGRITPGRVSGTVRRAEPGT